MIIENWNNFTHSSCSINIHLIEYHSSQNSMYLKFYGSTCQNWANNYVQIKNFLIYNSAFQSFNCSFALLVKISENFYIHKLFTLKLCKLLVYFKQLFYPPF